MGFHMYITCTMEICKETGRHYYYGKSQKIYDTPQVIPEMYREFVSMSGKIFRIYARLVTDERDTSVTHFVDTFPDWSDIVADDDFEKYGDTWDEDKHDKLRNGLKWFSEQDVCYMICWC